MHERVETEAAKVGKKREGKRRRESEVRSAAAATVSERTKEAKIVVGGGENKPCSNCIGLETAARQVC